MILSGLCGAALLAAAAPATNPERSRTPQKQTEGEPNIEAQAEEKLDEMCKYLAATPTFRVEVTSVDEKFTSKGQKVQELTSSRVTVQRPNEIRIERNGPNGHATFGSDGKTATVVNTDRNVYATVDAPQTMDELVDRMRERLHIDAPAGDFLSSDPCAVITDGMKEGRYIGLESLGDIKAHHLMFSRPDLDVQLWIEDGPTAVPLRYVLTSKDLPNQPQSTVELHGWETNVSTGADTFQVAIPQGAKRADTNARPPQPQQQQQQNPSPH
jgi:hypothetical protein